MILQPEADKSAHLSFAALLDLLNHTDDEFHAVCHESESVTFNSRVTDKQSAAEVVAGLPDNANVWFSVNPTKGPARIKDGRGGAADVTRLAALFADLDVKPGGCADDDVAHAIIDKLSEILGTGPMAITYSGHGVQPYWPVIHGEVHDDDDWDRIDTIIKRWGRLVQSVGKTVGAEADSVFNLDRILRVPETVNNKFPADPTPVVCYANGGRALTLDKIGLALNVYGIDSPIPSESPGRDFYGIDSESSDAEIKAWVKATFNEPDSMCYGMRVAADKWVTYPRGSPVASLSQGRAVGDSESRR